MGVRPRVRAREQARVERVVVQDLGRPVEAGARGRDRARILLEGAREAREGAPVLAQGRIVGHHDEVLRGVQHACGVEKPIRHDVAGGMGRRDLVLHDALGDGILQVRRQHRLGVLVDAAERPVAAVPALHREASGLLAPDALHGRQTAREALEVEDVEADRRRPQHAIVAAEEEAMRSAGFVTLAKGHDPGGGGLLGPERRSESEAKSDDAGCREPHGGAS
jgi:hypothetical protein